MTTPVYVCPHEDESRRRLNHRLELGPDSVLLGVGGCQPGPLDSPPGQGTRRDHHGDDGVSVVVLILVLGAVDQHLTPYAVLVGLPIGQGLGRPKHPQGTVVVLIITVNFKLHRA